MAYQAGSMARWQPMAGINIVSSESESISLHIVPRTNYEPESQNFPGFSYEPLGRVAYRA